MRAYLAVLKDSFREALASRVLLVTLIGIVAVLGLLAPFGLDHSVSTELRRSELDRPERLLRQLTEQAEQPGTPEAHLWGLLSEDQQEQVRTLQDPEQNSRPRRRPGPSPQKRRLVSLLNDLLQNSDFFDAQAWANVELDEEAQQLTEQASLTDVEEARRNLLLLAAAFPSAIDIVDSTAISLTYGTAVVQGPIPFTPDQFEMLFEQVLIAVVSVFLGFFGVFGCLLVTAGLIPRTFEAGEIALLLSKPVSRSLLFVVKFLGGCVFTLLYATVLVVGIWVLLGIRMDFWRHELLWCIPVYVFLFMIYYAVSAVAGAIWRNSIVALSLVVVFWLLVTVVGATREGLNQHLIEQRGIKDIVQAGPEMLTIDGEQQTWLWDQSTETWRQVFREESGGLGALARLIFGSAARFAPIYDAAGERILALQQTQSRFGGPGASKLVVGYADDDWERTEMAQVPEFVPTLLMTREGRIILPARRAIYEYVGQSEEARQQAEFLGRLSGGLLGRTTNGFEELQPDDWPDVGDEFAAALNPLTDDLWVFGEGQLHQLQCGEDGRYSVQRSRDFDTDDQGVIAVAGEYGVLALSTGSVQVLRTSSLETVQELQLDDKAAARLCTAAADGSQLAVLTKEDRLFLFDGTSEQLEEWVSPDSDVCSAVAFSDEGRLLTADSRLAVYEYELRATESVRTASWSEPPTWVYQLFDYVIVPAWTILPKPAELDQLVAWVMIRRDEEDSKRRGFGGFEDFEDEARRASFDPAPVLRDNALFVLVLLGFGCFYISRRDF